MPSLKIDFANALWKKQQAMTKMMNNPNVYTMHESFEDAYDNIENSQTVLQRTPSLELGSFLLARKKVGDNGKVIVVGETPDFPYQAARKIVGNKLTNTMDYYVNTLEGRELVRDCFSAAGAEVFGIEPPHYPSMVNDKSLDHVIIMPVHAMIYGRKKPDVFVEETHKKLKSCGSMIAISPTLDCLNDFSLIVDSASRKGGFQFEEKTIKDNILWKWQRYFKSPIEPA
jgi:hypothetical protein